MARPPPTTTTTRRRAHLKPVNTVLHLKCSRRGLSLRPPPLLPVNSSLTRSKKKKEARREVKSRVCKCSSRCLSTIRINRSSTRSSSCLISMRILRRLQPLKVRQPSPWTRVSTRLQMNTTLHAQRTKLSHISNVCVKSHLRRNYQQCRTVL
jgi:hypothetical protein